MSDVVVKLLLAALAVATPVVRADETVIDFEQAQIGKPSPEWNEKGVAFKLAGQPTQSKAIGRIMFFPHLATGHMGLLNAMATAHSIPVQASFAKSASSVTVVFWASTASAALLEALDREGGVVARASLEAAPVR